MYFMMITVLVVYLIGTILLIYAIHKTLLESRSHDQVLEYVKKTVSMKKDDPKKVTIMQPTRFDQILELIRLIKKDNLNGGSKKEKRLKRLDFIMQLKGYLTEDERILILRLATDANVYGVANKSSEGCLSVISSCFFKLCDIMMMYISIVINFVIKKDTNKVLLPRNWSKFTDSSSDTNSFLTREMHNNFLLYYIGIASGYKILQELISLYPYEYEDGDFYMVAKGGCVLAVDLFEFLLSRHRSGHDLNDDEIKEIFELFGRGDADFGLHLRPGMDALHSAITKDCKKLMTKIMPIFENNSKIRLHLVQIYLTPLAIFTLTTI